MAAAAAQGDHHDRARACAVGGVVAAHRIIL